MTVAEVERGLRVLTVFDGLARRARRDPRPRRDHRRRRRARSRARPSEQATALIKGPAGTDGDARGRHRQAASRATLELERARVDVPGRGVRDAASPAARKIAHVRLAGFTSGAHGEVREAVDELLDKGAEGVVLDLRDNGGGLLNEAVLVSSIFVDDGTIVSTEGRTRPRARVRGDRETRSTPTSRSSCSSTASRRRRRRSSPARCRTASAPRSSARARSARASSRRSASSPTAARSTSPSASTSRPSGRNLGGGGVKQGAGIEPDVKARDDAETEDRDEALEVAVEDGRARGRREPAPRGAGRRARARARRARRRRSGRRGAGAPRALPDRRAVLRARPADQRRPAEARAARRRPATSCWSRRTARAPGTGACVAGSAAPTSRATCSRR